MGTLYNKQYFENRDLLDHKIANALEVFILQKCLNRVLDVGCGTGRLVKFLNKQSFSTNKQSFSTNKQSFSTNKKGFEAKGVDNFEEAVRIARKINIKNSIVKASATKLPFKKNSFDLVTSISVIEHLSKKEARKFLKEAYRILKKNGYIFLVTPNFSSPARLIFGKKWFAYADPTHINFFTIKSLAKLLSEEGFKNHNTIFKIKFKKLNIQTLLLFLFHSTPLANFRDSFWISAQKKQEE